MHHTRPALSMGKLAVLVVALTLAGCGGINLSPTNPPGIDLSGVWLIDFTQSDTVPDFRDRRPPKQFIRRETTVRSEARRIARGSGLAFITHDFEVLRADKLEIELNPESMGIHYHPGVYRDVSWGERQRGLWKVHAGWEERTLVILSKAKDLQVIERFDRTAPNTLQVQVLVEADGDEEAFTRTFKRRA